MTSPNTVLLLILKLIFAGSCLFLANTSSANMPQINLKYSQVSIIDSGPGYTSYFTGDTNNVTPSTLASILLVGGGEDRDDAMQWFVERSGKGDILILRESGTDGYNDWLMTKGANSVHSIVITSSDASHQSFVIDAIRNAEGIFFAGGDQSNYVRYMKNTAIAHEINAAALRGIPIGGTSAGLAILGQFVYAAYGNSISSQTALSNPFSADLTLDKDFLAHKALEGVITDSHFVARNRMGRLLAFMARIIVNSWSATTKGIAVDEEVAIGFDENSIGFVFANNNQFAYALSSTSSPIVCEPDTPLSFANVEITRLGKESTFNFKNWTGSNSLSYRLNVNSGVVQSSRGLIY